MVQRSAVGREEMLVVLQEQTQTLAIDGSPGRLVPVTVHTAPQGQIEMEGPAAVVVERPTVAVRVPAAPAVHPVDQLEVSPDLVLAVGSPHRLEERVDDHREEQPVRMPVAFPLDTLEPFDNTFANVGRELLPDPRPRFVEGSGDLCGLDERLCVVIMAWPGLRTSGIRSGCESFRVAADEIA